MASENPNLLGSLYRWVHRHRENFLTDAFTWVLVQLCEAESEESRRIISTLVFGDDSHCREIGCPTIRSQIYVGGKCPDIQIESDSLLAFIEVKLDSPYDPEQIRAYRALAREEAKGKIARIISLTRDPVDPALYDVLPDLRLRWRDVPALLSQSQFTSELAQFISKHFVQFLKEVVMGIEQVGWEYVNGIPAMRSLLGMIGQALDKAGLRSCRSKASWDYIGYSIDSDAFWAGIYFNEPTIVYWEFWKNTVDEEQVKAQGGVIDENRTCFRLDLTSEDTCFFARSKDRQLAILTEFMREAHAKAQKCLIQQPPDSATGKSRIATQSV